jgi:hypothetical protein
MRRRRAQAAAHVLGLPSPAEEARLAAREREDVVFAAEAARLRGVALRLAALAADDWNLPEPPPLAHPALRPARSARPRRLTLRPAVAALAAVALLAAGAAAGALLEAPGDEGAAPPVARVTLARFGDAPARAHAQALVGVRGRRTMTLEVSGLAPTHGGTFYEVWMLRSPTQLVSVGSFRVDASGRARVTFPVAADARRFPIVDVSREPADGDPRHSSDSVLRSRPIRS